ncbi:glutamate-1-semialdehyde 2,1-aminomutase [Desulfonispora thiosulfatigenes DSM 11270]|uniref:Glutamate-1-semialdehyde 2,1-aminomutase n=1 Tax=Desulfonispora thiosulfatigenes DSM 11270 TaxID=656914 RepID=A0A1W1VLE6_DESTI|nr:glutamate-1-semialdehyde 2,1-aminomutase [Desulfonispora thiosulfatigenes]SMB94205.1 glutamate-1-semialdehyde 2,1-aminomutase [Desulfonispora thiosulfatigenes DSM 11270]
MNKGYELSQKLFAEAKEYIPGGVNSPVRAFTSVDTSPVFIDHGLGSKFFDVDGNEYIDYVLSWGPLILGHCHPSVVKSLEACILKGTGFGTPTEIETEVAKKIVNAIPSIEMVRMVNSGTEATMSALRLARAYTNRDKIVKFEGCYHGHSDPLLIKAGSGALTHGVPSSPGVPASIAGNTINATYNDLEGIKKIFKEIGEEVAAVIIEPVAGNMGTVLPEPGFLEGIREVTKEYGALLIFDEVMTGYRVAFGGAQCLYNIKPDITCLGKIIGGGLPVGAYGGSKEIMSKISPSGSVYQAGTLSGNPLAMSAGLAILNELEKEGVYEKLNTLTTSLTDGLKNAANKVGVPVTINKVGAMFTLFFTDEKVNNFTTATSSNLEKFNVFFKHMLSNGIYFAPSQFESAFLSTAHTQENINYTIQISEEAFNKVKNI